MADELTVEKIKRAYEKMASDDAQEVAADAHFFMPCPHCSKVVHVKLREDGVAFGGD